MSLLYQENGTLVPGIHELSWDEFRHIYEYNDQRAKLIPGLAKAMQELKEVNCSTLYVDGSFVTKEQFPEDFDACWDETNVNFNRLKEQYKGLMDFGYKMKTMKARYGGTIVPMTNIADMDKGIIFFWFFQEDRQGRQKGIIKLSLI